MAMMKRVERDVVDVMRVGERIELSDKNINV